MRVGIYVKSLGDPESGGGFTLQDDIIHALDQGESRHEFYVFHDGNSTLSTANHLTFISLEEFSPPRTAENRIVRLFRKVREALRYIFTGMIPVVRETLPPLQLATRVLKIDLLWYLSPAHQETDVPYVATVWDLAHRMMPMFPEVRVTGWDWESREKHYSKVLPKAAYVVTGTEEGRRQIETFYGLDSERIRILPFPTPSFSIQGADDSSTMADAPLPGPYLFYPAQFWPHKNHVVILKAMKRLKEDHDLVISAVFSGSDKGNLKCVQELAKTLGLSGQVYFPGFISRVELIRFYRNAVALVYPSLFGPDNLPPLEAFALGCPVIAGDIPGAKEQLKDAAMIVSPIDDKAWADAILEIVDDHSLRNALVSRALGVSQSLRSSDYVRGMFEVIDEYENYLSCWRAEVDSGMHYLVGGG